MNLFTFREAILQADDAIENIIMLCILNEITATNKLETIQRSCVSERGLDFCVLNSGDRRCVEVIIKGFALGNITGIFNFKEEIIKLDRGI